ncbi:MAG: Inosose isomerase [Pseudomonas sp.]|nr:MAG: Inosose isomerase [Pseudomonas sp.]
MAEDLGIALDLYQPLRDFEGVSPAQLQRNLARAERKFDVMQALGIPMLLVCSNAQPDAIGNPDLIAEQLRDLAEHASARGLKVAFEALSWGTHTNRYAQAWAAVERAGHPSLGLVLDSYHSLALRDDVSAIAELPGERIFFLQISDSPWDSSSPPCSLAHCGPSPVSASSTWSALSTRS